MFACLVAGAVGGQMRLSLPPEFRILDSAVDPCANCQELNKSTLTWNHDFAAPWNAQNESKAYSCPDITALVNKLGSERVPGLSEGDTFWRVWGIFQDAGCLLYIHGGAIRDMSLGLTPKDIDIEFSCPATVMYDICSRNFGAGNCYVNGNYFQMGKLAPESEYEELEGVGWNGTIFADPVTKEYTTNCLSYDLNGLNVTIDVVGTGLNDTCNRRIVIPVDQTRWDDWFDESVYYCNDGLAKIPRFWKLRAYPKSFSASAATMNWLSEKITTYWNQSFGSCKDACNPGCDRTVASAFRKFYCGSVRCDRNVKDVIQLRVPLDKSLKNKMDWYNFALMADMGAEWFDHFIASSGMNFFIPPACEAATADTRLKAGTIVAIVLGCVGVVVGVIGLVYGCCACYCPNTCKQKDTKETTQHRSFA